MSDSLKKSICKVTQFFLIDAVLKKKDLSMPAKYYHLG